MRPPEPPSCLSPPAARAWRRLATEHPELVAGRDPEVVAIHCRALADFTALYDSGEQALITVLAASKRLLALH
jgi:phage terminase small subunit